MPAANAKARKALAGLQSVARVAAAVVDGEEAQRIITERAIHYIANPNPQHRYMSGDYYDVNFETFLRMKKLLRPGEALRDLMHEGHRF